MGLRTSIKNGFNKLFKRNKENPVAQNHTIQKPIPDNMTLVDKSEHRRNMRLRKIYEVGKKVARIGATGSAIYFGAKGLGYINKKTADLQDERDEIASRYQDYRE